MSATDFYVCDLCYHFWHGSTDCPNPRCGATHHLTLPADRLPTVVHSAFEREFFFALVRHIVNDRERLLSLERVVHLQGAALAQLKTRLGFAAAVEAVLKLDEEKKDENT